MRLARCEIDGAARVALVQDDELVVLDADDPVALLTGAVAPAPTGTRVPLSEARLLAPLVPRRNVLCVGWNYLPHFEEGATVHGARELPDRPNFFTKATGTVIGPDEPVPAHADITEQLDFEVELGAIIGDTVRDLDESNAMDAIVGYVVANDISARDLQKSHGGQWFKGKSLDGTCPIGPWIVSPDEIDDPQALDISCTVNGETMQSSNTRHMIFPIPQLLMWLSQGFTLFPGDLFLTGTPEGVGFTRTPPVLLHAGDVLESTVEGLGTLRNPIA